MSTPPSPLGVVDPLPPLVPLVAAPEPPVLLPVEPPVPLPVDPPLVPLEVPSDPLPVPWLLPDEPLVSPVLPLEFPPSVPSPVPPPVEAPLHANKTAVPPIARMRTRRTPNVLIRSADIADRPPGGAVPAHWRPPLTPIRCHVGGMRASTRLFNFISSLDATTLRNELMRIHTPSSAVPERRSSRASRTRVAR